MNRIKVIIKRPGEPHGYVTNISNTLEKMQEIVYGHIEAVPIADGVVLICNEEGKMRGLPPNFLLGSYSHDVICGPAIIAGVAGEDFADVPIGYDFWKKLLQSWGN